MIDFTDCPRSIFRVYGGANGMKIGIEYDGHPYMLKFQPRSHPKYGNNGYANSCLSEHIGCRVLETIGLRTQETILGVFRKSDGTIRQVVACRDFTEGGLQFRPFLDIRNSCLDSEGEGGGTELGNISMAIREQRWVDPEALDAFFWDMFVGDALVGNFDRHNGNWGLLLDPNNIASIAPIFDCGSCLYPQLPVDDYERVLGSREEIDIRLFQRPESAILQNGARISYGRFLHSCGNEGCNEALRRLHPRMDMDRILDVVDGCEGLSDIQRRFYITMLTERKEKLIDPAFEKLESLD